MKDYGHLWIRQDILKEFRKRAKSVGLSYSEFLKRLMVEYDSRRTKELKEFFELLEGIHRKLDDLIAFSILQKAEAGASESGSTTKALDTKVILVALRELARKLIVLQSERQAFETLIEELLKKYE